MLPMMFVVSEAETAAIRAVFHQSGAFAAAIELRRLLPRHHRQHARRGRCARIIADWTGPLQRRPKVRLTPGALTSAAPRMVVASPSAGW